MELKIQPILVILLGCILLAALLPTALTALYQQKTADAGHAYGYDAYGKAIATDLNVTDDSAVSAIFQLFPLFAVLGGMAILAGFALRQGGFI